MFIEIETESVEPIYVQLIKQLKKAIVKGDINRGEMFPSVRVLAGDLGVNMHTVNKAYNLLVDEEILVKSQRGYMLNPNGKQPADLEKLLKEKIEDILVDVYIHDLPVENIMKWTQAISKELRKE